MKDVINMILCWLIIPTILFIGTTIKPLGLLIGYLFAGLASIYGIIVIGMMLMAVGTLLASPFISDNN